MEFGSYSTYKIQGIINCVTCAIWTFGLGLEIPALSFEAAVAKIGMVRADIGS